MTHRRPRSLIPAAVLALALPASAVPARVGDAPGAPVSNDSFYSLQTNTLAGKPADLAHFPGKGPLGGHVARAGGFPPPYQGLEAPPRAPQAKRVSSAPFP